VKKPATHWIWIVLLLVLPAGVLVENGCHQSHPPVVQAMGPAIMPAEDAEAGSIEQLLRDDPLAALAEARKRLIRDHRDYTCTFTRQELLPSGMTAEQELEVKFRAEPYSVMLKWIRNKGLVDRVIYVKDKWVDHRAEDPALRQLALAQPSSLAGLFIKSTKQPIRGSFAKGSSRHSIDEFGFEATLRLFIKYCRRAMTNGELQLDFKGETSFCDRPVWLLRRRLPYSQEAGVYPDRLVDLYIDKEYMVPVAIYCYSDDDRKPQDLLGKYEYRNIRFDVCLTEADFEPRP